MARHLPSPLDLWRSWTPSSLLLLPFVFVIFVLLQLPLHHNSSTERSEWQARADTVDALSAELEGIGRELDGVRRDHDGVRDMVGSLRRRLDRIAERREARETYLKLRLDEREKIERDEEERRRKVLREDEHHMGMGVAMAKGGPLMNVSMVEARAVATYVGKLNADTDT